MSGFYARTRKMASRMLRKYGVKVMVRRTTPGLYDPTTGEEGAPAIAEWTPFALKTNITEQYQSGYTSLGASADGTRVEIGDMQILVDCEGQPNIPAKGDKVIFPNGEEWTITADYPVSPAGETVLYKGLIRLG